MTDPGAFENVSPFNMFWFSLFLDVPKEKLLKDEEWMYQFVKRQRRPRLFEKSSFRLRVKFYIFCHS